MDASERFDDVGLETMGQFRTASRRNRSVPGPCRLSHPPQLDAT
ncbi:hypothetical protein [Natrarchaeobius halalkaliphilus]|nr:hypothetical protein [Natrarchaeobius halalkaliphilus]